MQKEPVQEILDDNHNEQQPLSFNGPGNLVDVNTVATIEQDAIHAALLYPPLRFGRITPKIYRGAYPTLKNFRFLRRLTLKTIISFVPETPTEDLRSFASLTGIEASHFQVPKQCSSRSL